MSYLASMCYNSKLFIQILVDNTKETSESFKAGSETEIYEKVSNGSNERHYMFRGKPKSFRLTSFSAVRFLVKVDRREGKATR
jgi:hypothetical protein